MVIGLGHYLTVAAVLFTLGVFGIFINRKNVIVILMSIELILVVGTYTIDPGLVRSPSVPIPAADVMTNTEALGQVLYTRYFYFFQAAGLILLVAMIGAIVLTLRERVGVRRQDISRQNARTQQTAVEVRKVPFRQGI